MHAVGELTLDAAWAMLRDDPAATLVDVRTAAEWHYVGVPVLDAIGKQPHFVEWLDFPDGTPNAAFVHDVTALIDPGRPVLLLCRSGARSLAAAEALAAAGYGPTYNISDGFEGPIDEHGHRRGGWRGHGLDWRQS